jgi:regulatory protein
MILNDIKPQQRREGRSSLYLDDQFWIGVDDLIIIDLGLKIGQEITEERREDIETHVVEYEAMDKAIRYLNYGPRSEQEVRKKLGGANNRYTEDGYTEEMIDRVIEKLVGYNYINDGLWVEELVRSARTIGKGPRWIEQKARQAGITSDLISEATAEFDREGQVEAALEYCQRNRVSAEDTGKLWRRLASRGYSPDVIYAVKAALEVAAEDES